MAGLDARSATSHHQRAADLAERKTEEQLQVLMTRGSFQDLQHWQHAARVCPWASPAQHAHTFFSMPMPFLQFPCSAKIQDTEESRGGQTTAAGNAAPSGVAPAGSHRGGGGLCHPQRAAPARGPAGREDSVRCTFVLRQPGRAMQTSEDSTLCRDARRL